MSMLLYADDMVLMADNTEGLQLMLNTMFEWCRKWKLRINVTKSQIVHFRKPRQKVTDCVFKYGDMKLDIVTEYKYLGVIFDEFIKFKRCSKTLASLVAELLSAVISKFKEFKVLG